LPLSGVFSVIACSRCTSRLPVLAFLTLSTATVRFLLLRHSLVLAFCAVFFAFLLKPLDIAPFIVSC
jgi:hypothetical protein